METGTLIEQIALDKYAASCGQERLDGLAVSFGIISGVLVIIEFILAVYCSLKPPSLFEIIELLVLTLIVGAFQSFLGFLLFTWTFDRCFIGVKAKARIISLLSDKDKKIIIARYIETIFN